MRAFRTRCVPLSERRYRPARALSVLRRLVGIAAAICLAAAIGPWSGSAFAGLTRPYLSSFGSFTSVQGVAIDQATEDVYVYDGAGEAIYKFDAAGNPVNFSSTGTNDITGVPSAFSDEGEIAIDSSAGPAKGDIYVAHASYSNVLVYNEAGEQVGELTEEAGKPWGEACGVAVGSDGAVYVGLYSSVVNKYVPSSGVVTDADYVGSYEGVSGVCNVGVDPAGNLFVDTWSQGPLTSFAPSQLGVASAEGNVIDESGSTVAVDPATEHVFVDEQSQVSEFGPNGKPEKEPLGVFGASGPGALSGSLGIAVNAASNEVYAASGTRAVNVYGKPVIVPGAKTTAASNVEAETATATGEVDPEGLAVEECYFEYGESTSYGQSAPCAESEGEIGTGTGYVKVHADLAGLASGTVYHYRLVAANENGSALGEDVSFVYLVQKVESEYVADVTATSAVLGGSLDPNGTSTEYFFEYGTTTSYGMRTVAHEALGETTQTVRAQIGELLANTTYHYRLATNSGRGAAYGQDLTFTTEGVGGPLQLLDGREWELVSPPVKHGAGILKEAHGGGSIVEASTSGNAITYIASSPIEDEPEGNGAPEASQIISRRNAAGVWSSRTLDVRNEEVHPLPIGHGLPFKMFNPSLTVGALEVYGYTPLAPNATEERAPYLRQEAACEEGSSDCFVPTLTREDTMRGAEWDKGLRGSVLLETRFVDATEDLKHVVISSESPLTEGAVEHGLYEWTEGHLENVSVNESGEAVAAQLGGNEENNVRGAISNNGERLFWCEHECGFFGGPLFMRDTATRKTVRIDQTGDFLRDFQIATEDGSRVFYSAYLPGEFTPQLWECTIVEVAGKLECERAEVAPGIEGLVLGINPTGSTVYFDSSEALTVGAEAGGNNLYVAHFEGGKWEPRLIAALDPRHGGYEGDTADWAGPNDYIQAMTARVAPNGRYLAFMSDRSLTGYDNRDATSGEPDEEVFLYDDQTHSLNCVSCTRSGARPDGLRFGAAETEALMDSHGKWDSRWVAADIPAWEASALTTGLHQPRYLSNEGRLFFNSATALVPQDSNGLADVYEYEPPGVGSCTQSEGCVQLISSGTSGEEATFLEASESGDNAFFITTAQLTKNDTDTEYDVYDARVCTESSPCAHAPVSPPPCSSGESCKPTQAPQPAIYGAPASATFNGSGNPGPKSAKQSGEKTSGKKQSARSRHLRRALRSCKRKDAKWHAKERRCEARARKRYGAAAVHRRREKSRGARLARSRVNQNGRGR